MHIGPCPSRGKFMREQQDLQIVSKTVQGLLVHVCSPLLAVHEAPAFEVR